MSAPKCPLCGANHWQRDPHIWSDDPKPKKAPKKRPKSVEPKPVEVVPVEPENHASGSEKAGQVEYNKRWREKNPDKYKEYMREYMRKKRAEK